MTLTINNLDAPLGVEISGIDLAQALKPDDGTAIRDALDRRLVVVARGQQLSDPALLAFSRNFGELDPPGA